MSQHMKERFRMKNLVHFATAIASVRESVQRSVWRRYSLFIPLITALTSFAFLLTARGVEPPPDGDYGNGNTAEGLDALFSLTTGFNNTAVGTFALYDTESGSSNTAKVPTAVLLDRKSTRLN